MQRRVLPHVVDDQHLVRQVQHEVALIGGARQLEPHRLELEHQIVAERAVKPEMLVLRAGEQLAERAQHREDAGLAAAFFLGKPGGAVADRADDAVRVDAAHFDRREVGESLSHRSEQEAPAFVERLNRKIAAARRQHQRRVDKPHVPARIAAGKLEARRKQDAAPMIEPVGQRRIGRAIGLFDDLAMDADAALGLIAGALHEGPLRVVLASEVP